MAFSRKFFQQHGSAGGKLGGSLGGKRRAAALTPARRIEIARAAAASRWARRKPESVREEAHRRFVANPAKTFQRHIREVHASVESRRGKPAPASLSGAWVKPISYKDAKDIILKYEWLGSMATGTRFSYGLFTSDNELLGAVCFSHHASPEARWICEPKSTIPHTICLTRGACVPHAPKNAASFLVRHACRMVHKEHGYSVFFAYSDPEAGERGAIYKAVGWKCLGAGIGRSGARFHTSVVAPDGTLVQSYSIARTAKRLGWTPEAGATMMDFLRGQGYTAKRTPDKIKWVWFEGPERSRLAAQCRFPFVA